MIGIHVLCEPAVSLNARPNIILYFQPGGTIPYKPQYCIGRIYHPNQDLSNPVEAARAAAEASINSAKQNGIEYWVGYNEPDVASDDAIERLVVFEMERTKRLNAVGLKAVVLNLSVGWPREVDGKLAVDKFKPLLNWLPDGNFVGLHEYWRPQGPLHQYDPNKPGLVYRFKHWPFDKPIFITECGIDIAGREGDGWKAQCPPQMNLEAWADVYASQIKEYYELVSQDSRFRGMLIFCYGPGYGWHNFDISSHISHFEKLFSLAKGIRVSTESGIITLPLEEYLRGVVPAEVFSSWHMEALKAQAVLARSYAKWRMQNPRTSTFDLYADARDQVYNPKLINKRTDAAVRDTAGVYLVQNGQPFKAQYINKCGQQTCLYCQGRGEKQWPGRACQYGLQALAEVGYSWRVISKLYYQNVRLNIEEDSMDEYFVNDLRGETSHIPRITSFTQLKELFGLEVDKSKGWDAAPEGAYVRKLVGFEVREGPALYMPKTLKEDGSPEPNILVFFSWPDAPEIANIKPNYSSRAVGGFTNSNGEVGFGLGPEGVVTPNGGPFMIWPSADPPNQPIQYSDCVKKLGWLGGTNHLVANPIFKVVRKGQPPGQLPDQPPPSQPPPDNPLVTLLTNLLSSRKWTSGLLILAILAVLTYLGSLDKQEFLDMLWKILTALFGASALQEGLRR